MSVWTSIVGTVGLETSPFLRELDENGCFVSHHADESIYLPYPEEQFSLAPPELITKDSNTYIEYAAEITSYPIIKRAVDDAIHKLPAGESDCIQYTVSKHPRHRVGSDIECPQVLELLKSAVMNVYGIDKRVNLTFDEIAHYKNITVGRQHQSTEAYLSIFDNVRSHDASEMTNAIIRALVELVGRGITLEVGNIILDDMAEKYTISIQHDEITVTLTAGEFGEGVEESVEYYQVFTLLYRDRPAVNELIKVTEFTDNNYIREE